MQEPIGEIVQLSDGAATVSVEAGVACLRCAAGKGCGAGLLAGSPGRKQFEVPVPENLELRPGDRVTLTLSPRQLLQASVTAYGLPLIALVAMPAVADWLWGPISDLSLAVVAILAVVLAALLGRRRLRRDGCMQRFVPSISARIVPRA